MIKNYLVNAKTKGQILLADGTILGRGKNCHVPIDDESLSKEHIRVTIFGSRVAIADLDSATGSKVNGTPLSANTPVVLKVQDKIEIGQQHFTFIQVATTAVEIPEIDTIEELELEIIQDNSRLFNTAEDPGEMDMPPLYRRPSESAARNRLSSEEMARYSCDELTKILKEQKEYLVDLKKFSNELIHQISEAHKLEREIQDINKKIGPLKLLFETNRTAVLDEKYKIFKKLDAQIKSLESQREKIRPELKNYMEYHRLNDQKISCKNILRNLHQTELKLEVERSNRALLNEQKYFKDLESQHSKTLYFEQQKKREEEMQTKREIQEEIKKLQEKMKKLG